MLKYFIDRILFKEKAFEVFTAYLIVVLIISEIVVWTAIINTINNF